MRQARTNTVLQLGMLLVFCACALGVDSSLQISQYAHTTWTIRDNFLKGAVRSIVQTPDGYLWLGTEFGLVRFDGVRTVPWVAPPGQSLPSSNIRSLAAGRDGTLWIGTVEGLASWSNGKLNRYAELAGQNVLTLLEDHEGTVWAGTFGIPRGKLCAIRRGEVKCYGEDGSIGQWVYSLYEDAGGRLWAGAETGLWRWKPGPPKRYPTQQPIETSEAIVQADNGNGVLAIAEGIRELVNDKIQSYHVPVPVNFTPLNLLRDHNGGLWIGTLDRGLLHVSGGTSSQYGQSDGLSGDRILSLFEDREGTIWAGTADGLDSFREFAVPSISVKQGLSSPGVMSVLAAKDGSVWLGTLAGLDRWRDGHVTIYLPRTGTGQRPAKQTTLGPDSARRNGTVAEIHDPGLPDDRAGSLFEDDRGRIWISTRKQVARFEGTNFSRVSEVPGSWVNAIAGDSHGGIWISYQDDGLIHFVNGKVVERLPWSRLGGNVVAASVLSDPVRGGLWLGFFGGGLAYVKDGQVGASYGEKEGLGRGRVMGLQLDPDGTLWAATEGGLSRLQDGRILTLASGNGLPCDTVHWEMQDRTGSFWLYTACGLLRVDRTELEAWASDPARKIKFTTFDSSDGVRSHALLTGYTPRVSKSADGRIWFAHFQSVSIIDPLHLPVNQLPPPVHIEEVIADGKTYDAAGALRLPPRVRDLEIHYTALSLVAPEKMRFRFMLEGQDKNWREVINLRRVEYSNLAPSNYRFRLMACNNSGVWNQEGASLDFSIAPAYYQTNWFRALCASAFLALLWIAYQIHVRHLHQQFNMRLEERVNERTRIARDLHDTLLQSFQSVLMKFEVATDILPEKVAEAHKMLETTTQQARKAIIEGRDVVQGLRSSTLVTNELARAIAAVGDELAPLSSDGNSFDFHVLVKGTSRDTVPIIRDEIYRIACEALRNAFKHAQAKRIQVELRYDPRKFQLRVCDNGKGIDPTVLAQGSKSEHYGLPGMQERARLVQGKLTILSTPDSGTAVELTIPASVAYARSATHRSMFFRKGA